MLKEWADRNVRPTKKPPHSLALEAGPHMPHVIG